MSIAKPSCLTTALLLAALLLSVGSGGFAAETADLTDAVQLLADVTLIDGECRSVTVDFGRAFQVAQIMGLRESDVMPTGARRPAFETATRQRLNDTSPDELCGSVMKAYGAHIPGLVKAR